MAWTNWEKAALLFFWQSQVLTFPAEGLRTSTSNEERWFDYFSSRSPSRSLWKPSATSRASWTTTSLRATRTRCRRRGGGTASWWTASVPSPKTAAPTTARWGGKRHRCNISLAVPYYWDVLIAIITCSLALALSPVKWTGKTLQFVIGKQKKHHHQLQYTEKPEASVSWSHLAAAYPKKIASTQKNHVFSYIYGDLNFYLCVLPVINTSNRDVE